jgi:hypothetical protein
MIIFPLITPWVWFQILTASSLDASAHSLEDEADVSPPPRAITIFAGADT